MPSRVPHATAWTVFDPADHPSPRTDQPEPSLQAAEPGTSGSADRPVTGDSAIFEGGLRAILSPRFVIAVVRDFYSRRMAWAALLISALFLAYGGGAVMFWYHAIYLGEGGPAISHWQHWLLDSSAGFIGLLPAIALILPLAGWLSAHAKDDQLRQTLYVIAGGAAFALVTAPGPFLHDALVGRGTWVATQVTTWWGDGRAPLPPAEPVGVVAEVARQVALGLPLYILVMAIALIVVRAVVRARHTT
ncbi:hypothetical protein Aple_057100 [Acrocarpospora pleiomorpha]|uniref:Uncharacterized protein n=1 Tax=Acrocarpospora pleiomorpha TaxID=90975 RepID=A0A5M3XTI1_9ACTN|nr:hypothetical protein [Acrocarpospora pleiomorpha]GES22811.1 hypothetical protein Aple_057100 [Acrocarpospora pleiomorpha]